MNKRTTAPEVQKSETEWKAQLSQEEYDVLRRHGTEAPFTGAYVDTKTAGVYRCKGCGAELFSSGTKFESASGWPSFTAPADRENVELLPDNSLMMRRTEVRCKRCGSHLGHVFDDGPGAAGERYCINSCALDLEPDPE